MAGYSSTPLAKKLGIKPGFKMRLINAPDYYFKLFADMPDDVNILTDKKNELPRGKPAGYLRITLADCNTSAGTPFLFLDSQHTF